MELEDLWYEFGKSHLILTARPKDVPHVRRTCPTSEGRAPRPKDVPHVRKDVPHVWKDVPYRAW
jgi:hypothetical protein